MCKHKTYVPLHGHSTYSFNDGVTKIEDIIKKAKEIGTDSIGLTEHGNLSSFYKFYKAAKESNIKPIIGCEFYQNDLYFDNRELFLQTKKKSSKSEKEIEDDEESDEYGTQSSNNHFLAYATDYEGVKNLIKLSNIGFENFYRKPLVSSQLIFEKLDDHNIVTTGCLQSKINQLLLSGNESEAIDLLKKLRNKFDKNFYIEIQLNHLDEQKRVNSFYEKVYNKTGIKPVLGIDFHYANEEDNYIQYLLYVIKQRQTINSLTYDKWFYNVRDLHIKTINEIYERAKKFGMNLEFLETAIDSTFEIRDKTNIEITTYRNNFPKFFEESNLSKEKLISQLKQKYIDKVHNGSIPKERINEYNERLKYEMQIIESKGFFDYFLILDDLLTNFVYKSGGATGAGRGSAGGSLVLFILDITKIDPIRHSLIFERFLNPARIDPADVDMDIDSFTQKNVEGYFKEKFGNDKVCHISNFIKFGAKTIVKDLCRIFELDFVLSNKLTGLFDAKPDVSIGEELKKAISIAKQQKDEKLLKFIEENRHIFDKYGDKFIGMVRQTGKHASGILISNKTLSESEMPVLKVDGEIVTAVQEGGDEREVSELGFCKLDILGLIASSVINETLKLIEKKYNIKDLERKILLSDLEDEKVYEQFEKGNCRDIFQFGSDNMINLIKQIRPKNIEDLCSINGLFRPAVIQSGGIDEYLKNRQNPEMAKQKLSAIHPKLWEILKNTFGIPIFQEDIMFILREIGGFTLAEADKGRKILKLLHKGNQDKTDAFFKMLKQFKDRARDNGISEKDLDWLLDILAKYSEYSFCRAHSFAYALNAYIAMYLKVYYPLEYYSSLLNNSTMDEVGWFMKQMKASNIRFNSFKYKKTSDKFSVDYNNNSIKIGLNLIKGLASADIDKINNLTANNLIELSRQITENKISKRTIEPLCRIDYFSEIFENSRLLEFILIECKRLKKKEILEDKIKTIIEANKDIKDFSIVEKNKFQKEYLQFYITEHPLNNMLEQMKQNAPELLRQFLSPKQIRESFDSGQLMLIGLVNDFEMRKSKKTGREYFKIILEDDEKQIFITSFDARDVSEIKSGDIIVIPVDKNNFGFTKQRKTKIEILKQY